MKSGKEGFTLIELMVVLAVFGILSTIAVPNIFSAVSAYKLHSAANDFYFLLRKARFKAIKEMRPVIIDIEFTSDGNRTDGRYIFDADGSRVIYPACGSLSCQYGSSVHFGFGKAKKGAPKTGGPLPKIPLTFQSNRVRFNSLGLNTSGFVYLANTRGDAFAVGATSTGAIKLRKWNGKNWK